MKWLIAVMIVVGLVTAKPLEQDVVVVADDLKTYIGVIGKITGKNIIVDVPLDIKISVSIPKGADDSELIESLKVVLDNNEYKMVEVGTSLLVTRKDVMSKVLYAKGDTKRLADVLTQRAFMVKHETGRSVFVNPDVASQSVSVVGYPQDVIDMESVFTTADIATKKVIIEAKIVELSSNEISKLGMSFGLVRAGSSASDVIGQLSTQQFANNAIKGYTQIGSEKKSMVLSASFDFLSQTGSVFIVDEPSIEVASGKTSELYNGTSLYIQDKVDRYGKASYTKTDIGLRLTVKPIVSNSGLVNLDLTILAENKTGYDSNGKPIIIKKKLHSNTQVKDGQAVILGSVNKQGKSESSSGIPGLRSIPVIGYLFGSVSEDGSKKSMVIILTAHIVWDGDVDKVRDRIEDDKRFRSIYASELYNKFVLGNDGPVEEIQPKIVEPEPEPEPEIEDDDDDYSIYEE